MRGHVMANFSVEWLSESLYAKKKDTGVMTVQKDEPKNSPSSPNNSCGYTSGSESEVGEDSEGEMSKQRRMRTKFTSEQIKKLESTFNKHKYLGASQRRKIAEKLNLSETQVKTWFQNRRMKLKREVHEMRRNLFPVPAFLLPPVQFQHQILGGQFHQSSPFYAQFQSVRGPAHPSALHWHHTIIPRPFY
ncbi:ventral expressed homeobox [Festucalex cinctus]